MGSRICSLLRSVRLENVIHQVDQREPIRNAYVRLSVFIDGPRSVRQVNHALQERGHERLDLVQDGMAIFH